MSSPSQRYVNTVKYACLCSVAQQLLEWQLHDRFQQLFSSFTTDVNINGTEHHSILLPITFCNLKFSPLMHIVSSCFQTMLSTHQSHVQQQVACKKLTIRFSTFPVIPDCHFHLVKTVDISTWDLLTFVPVRSWLCSIVRYKGVHPSQGLCIVGQTKSTFFFLLELFGFYLPIKNVINYYDANRVFVFVSF